MRAVVSVVGGLQEAGVKRLLGYSSILSTGWLIAGGSWPHVIAYLGVYSISLIVLIYSLCQFEARSTYEVFFYSISRSVIVLLVIALLNFRGLPPFTLFYFKLALILDVSLSGGILVLASLILGAAFYVYIYVRLCLPRASITQLIHRVWGFQASRVAGLLVLMLGRGPLLLVLYDTLSFDLRPSKEIYYI